MRLHLLKRPFEVVREGQKDHKRTLRVVYACQKVEKGHLLKCPFRVVDECQKTEKGHLLKCPFGVVREGQSLKKDTC